MTHGMQIPRNWQHLTPGDALTTKFIATKIKIDRGFGGLTRIVAFIRESLPHPPNPRSID